MSLGAPPRRRVGLLGGSFNPAHAGHRHISLEALKRLDLDEVWWLVAPQNPLKPARGMAPFKTRLGAAAKLADDRRIKVLDLEAQLGTHYTVDTLAALQRRFPRTRFVWLMGADNLAQIRHWRRWTEIFNGGEAVCAPEGGTRGGKTPCGTGPTRLGVSTDQARHELGHGYPLPPRAAAQREGAADGSKEEVTPIPRIKSRPRPTAAESQALLDLTEKTLADGKAEDLVVIDLQGKSGIADYMVIATGRSQRQVVSLAERLLQALKENGHGQAAAEGLPHGDWVLIDAGDVIIHLFRPEVRSYYNLEKMWGATLGEPAIVLA